MREPRPGEVFVYDRDEFSCIPFRPVLGWRALGTEPVGDLMCFGHSGQLSVLVLSCVDPSWRGYGPENGWEFDVIIAGGIWRLRLTKPDIRLIMREKKVRT